MDIKERKIGGGGEAGAERKEKVFLDLPWE
jgi:hypothetical protein